MKMGNGAKWTMKSKGITPKGVKKYAVYFI